VSHIYETVSLKEVDAELKQLWKLNEVFRDKRKCTLINYSHCGNGLTILTSLYTYTGMYNKMTRWWKPTLSLLEQEGTDKEGGMARTIFMAMC
jgi:hypothetical protein